MTRRRSYPPPPPIFLEIDRETAEHPQRRDFRTFFRKATPPSSLAGRIVFTFPELEIEGKPITTDPIVRGFYRYLFEKVPFLLYFMEPTPFFGAVLGMICADARDDQIAECGESFEISYDEELNRKLALRLTDAAIFANACGDDWHSMIEEYPFSDEVKSAAIKLTEGRL